MRHFLLPFALLLSLSLAAQVPTYVPTDGLVAWYGLESDALDGSGNGNDLTTAGNPQWLSSDGQGYADLDGNGDFFFNDDPSFPVLNEIFVSCWVRIDAFGSGGGSNLKPIISKWNSSGAGENSFIIYESDNNIRWVSDYGSNTSPTFSYQHNWPTGQWHHIAAYYGDSLKLFIDGSCVSAGINVSDYDNSNSNFRIGDWYSSISSNYSTLDGGIRSVGIWNRGLSAVEAQALFTEIPPVAGCMEESACNYNAEANVDDGNCILSGCMEEGACNYNAAAECEGEACDYSCCPGPGCCGAGTLWDATLATCVVDIPNGVDTACTLMNLQELASGYAALAEQNAALDSLLSACEGDGAANASGPCAGQDHVTYQGHEYAIVEIGNQCWFAENLQTEVYNNGEPLQSDLNSGSWSTTNEGSYSIYNGEETNSIDLGFLYNWHAVTDGRGLCPLGWSVPTEVAWISLEEYIESNHQADEIGLHIKSTESWTSGNGINTYGFGAKAAGYRSNESGEYNYIGNYTYFWSSTPSSSNSAFVRRLDYFSDNLTKYSGNDNLNQGFSVRCVKD